MPPTTPLHTLRAASILDVSSRLRFPAARDRTPSGRVATFTVSGGVRIVDGSVEFRDRPDYLIPVARLQTPLQILGCVSHLMTKPWITPEAARAFIGAVCHHHGIRMVETA